MLRFNTHLNFPILLLVPQIETLILNTDILPNSNYRCSAPVGWKPERGRIDVSLGGRNCLSRRGTVQHELLHALGFWHEHSRTDRDLNILIQWDNILKGECINNTSTLHIDAQNQYFTLISLMIRVIATSGTSSGESARAQLKQIN